MWTYRWKIPLTRFKQKSIWDVSSYLPAYCCIQQRLKMKNKILVTDHQHEHPLLTAVLAGNENISYLRSTLRSNSDDRRWIGCLQLLISPYGVRVVKVLKPRNIERQEHTFRWQWLKMKQNNFIPRAARYRVSSTQIEIHFIRDHKI